MRSCFFFSSRRRHTRYWRDWSSDVCSSDLRRAGVHRRVEDDVLRALVVVGEAQVRALVEEPEVGAELGLLVPLGAQVLVAEDRRRHEPALTALRHADEVLVAAAEEPRRRERRDRAVDRRLTSGLAVRDAEL